MMNSPSAVVCREIFDENSQPSAEEISDYAHQLGIDPESESHLLPLAKDGLMQALPAPWKAYFDEKLETHYYYNEETKKTQWEHPLDNVYRELVKKARDSSVLDDTCASVQEFLTSEDYTKNLERVETKVESDDDDLTTDSDHQSDVKENTPTTLLPAKRLTPLGRPPLAPLSKIDKKLSDLKISPLRRSIDNPVSIFRPELSRPPLERPKMLFKQQSEIIDLKINVLNSPEEENFTSLLSMTKPEKGLPLTGKGSMFFKVCKSDLPSPDTEKSLQLDSMTKSDPPKGILREKLSHSLQRRSDSIIIGRSRQTSSFEDDKKSVRFKLENLPEPNLSPGSNSSSEQNEGQSSIISATPAPTIPSPIIPSSPVIQSPISSPHVPLVPSNPPLLLSPLVSRPPLPPRPLAPLELNTQKNFSLDMESKDVDNDKCDVKNASPGRRLLRPPAADYIKPDLFQKNFQKISDLVRPGDIETSTTTLKEPICFEKETRPRSPMIPQKNKISINLMESIESETSVDSPDAEFANLDLNDLDESEDKNKDIIVRNSNQASPNNIEEIEKMKNDEELSINKTLSNSVYSPPSKETFTIPQIKVPKLDVLSKQSKIMHSDSDDSKKSSTKDEPLKTNSRSESIEIKEKIQLKSPTPSYGSDIRSPRSDVARPWSNLSTFKPLNRAVVTPIKASDSNTSLGKPLSSPRLDGVILSQGKSSNDNVVVVYQFESQEDNFPKPIKSPLIPDVGRDMIERNKADERRRLDLSLQKELENIRMEWTSKERKMKADLLLELKEAEDLFTKEMKLRLSEQADRHKKEIEEAVSKAELDHQISLQNAMTDFEHRYKHDIADLEKEHNDKVLAIQEEYQKKLFEQKKQLEIENERNLSELLEQLQSHLQKERSQVMDENRVTVQTLRDEHSARVADLRNDYRAEVESLRRQHACHLEEVRRRLAVERASGGHSVGHGVGGDRALHEKYRALKEKYARLKHDVKMSIERRNKRREMSMTTGSETEKSNSHKATQSLERCKEVNETSVSAVIEHIEHVEQESTRQRNNNQCLHYNDNDASQSDKNVHNNNHWTSMRHKVNQSIDTSETSGSKNQKPHRKATVAFREPPRRRREKDRDATTDFQDSSDATTADEKPKESINGHGRRRCFTRLKSASTSRLNYSPKRGEGWSSPLESLRQQLRKLDDLEDQFPDLACQPAYSLRYPFAELGAVTAADTPELEFVRHRALVEREGMRRARAVLKRRRAALRETRASLSPHRAPSEERESTELEVALHRARALLGEKEIRLRHIERALKKLADSQPPPLIQEATTSEASSEESATRAEAEAGGAVLRSLRALHADVRDIWRALDARRPHTASPETSSCMAQSSSQARTTRSAPEQLQDNDTVAERARGLRAWLQAP